MRLVAFLFLVVLVVVMIRAINRSRRSLYRFDASARRFDKDMYETTILGGY